MPIPYEILDHLNHNNVNYNVIKHKHSSRSFQTSQFANINPDKLAKAVLLKDEQGYMLAVLPASRRIDMKAIRKEFGVELQMANEDEIAECFPDCELGAIPGIGNIYGYRTIVDIHLQLQPDIYFESGDHEDIIHISESDFEKIMPDADFSVISKDWD